MLWAPNSYMTTRMPAPEIFPGPHFVLFICSTQEKKWRIEPRPDPTPLPLPTLPLSLCRSLPSCILQSSAVPWAVNADSGANLRATYTKKKGCKCIHSFKDPHDVDGLETSMVNDMHKMCRPKHWLMKTGVSHAWCV